MSKENGNSTFKIAGGVALGLFLFFVVLPMAMCGGCAMCAGAAGVSQQAQERAETKELGPAIEISDSQFRVMDSNPYIHEVTYSFVVKSNRPRTQSKSFKVKFEDASGLIVEEDSVFGEKIPANGTKKVSGKIISDPEDSATIDSMLVEEN